MRGVIKNLIVSERSGNYGFITDEAGDDRYFNGKSVLYAEWHELQRGARVTFEPSLGGRDGKGLRAVKVRLDA